MKRSVAAPWSTTARYWCETSNGFAIVKVASPLALAVAWPTWIHAGVATAFTSSSPTLVAKRSVCSRTVFPENELSKLAVHTALLPLLATVRTPSGATVTSTSSVPLRAPSDTVRVRVYVVPGVVPAVKVGFWVVAPLSVIPAGATQLYVRGWFSGSEPVPLSVTVLPGLTVWSVPAFANGALLAATVTVTVSGALAALPSLTTRLTVYTPGRSALKVGVAVVPPASVPPDADHA